MSAVAPVEIAARVTDRLMAMGRAGTIAAINIELIRAELARELEMCPDDVATFDTLEEVTVRRLIEVVSMAQDSDRDKISRALAQGRCPDCDGDAWRNGPRGGASQNIECRGCLARFNVTRHNGQIIMAHRIDSEAEGGATWNDARLAELDQIEAGARLLAGEIGKDAAALIIGYNGPLSADALKLIIAQSAYQLILPVMIAD